MHRDWTIEESRLGRLSQMIEYIKELSTMILSDIGIVYSKFHVRSVVRYQIKFPTLVLFTIYLIYGDTFTYITSAYHYCSHSSVIHSLDSRYLKQPNTIFFLHFFIFLASVLITFNYHVNIVNKRN